MENRNGKKRLPASAGRIRTGKRSFLTAASAILSLSLALLLVLSSCGNDSFWIHSEHSFTQKNTDRKYLKSEATCLSRAVYYYSCECGEAGEETFEYGEPGAHSFTEKNTDPGYFVSEAGERSYYSYSCSVCGARAEDLLFEVDMPVWSGITAGGFESGSGTEEDPFIIATAEQLAYLSELSLSEKKVTIGNSYFRLVRDIRLNDTFDWEKWGESPPEHDWHPIGSAQGNFTGHFDGGGHVIRGVYIDLDGGSNLGLFGAVSGSVSNLCIEESWIRGVGRVGGICGFCNRGTLENCLFDGIVTASEGSGASQGTGSRTSGGICGYAANGVTIRNCQNSGRVSGTSETGGICGECDWGKIENCLNTGEVTTGAGGDSCTGGICGKISKGSVADCKNSGMVDGQTYAGGICGYSAAAVSRCSNTGKVTCSSDSCGGICGAGYEIRECFNTGNIKGNDYTGGIAGRCRSICDCFNTGEVRGLVCTGGIQGYMEGDAASTARCYNAGEVRGEYSTGSLCGEVAMGVLTDCCYLDGSATDGSGQVQYGIGSSRRGENTPDKDTNGITKRLTSSEMLRAESYPGLDFSAVWSAGDSAGSGLPVLKWQFDPVAAGHVHLFDRKQLREEYLISLGDCHTPSVYYFSCACGEKGEESFEYQTPHDFRLRDTGDKYLKTAGQDGKPSVYYYKCALCGDAGTEYCYETLLPSETPVWNGSAVEGFESGNGTKSDPDIIKTAEQLAFLAESVRGGNSYRGKYFRLESDIYLNDSSYYDTWGSYHPEPENGWTPIGTAVPERPFSGIFDGGGHAVRGMYFYEDDTGNNNGLFGCIIDGAISNLVVEKSWLLGGSESGGICGRAIRGSVTDCSFSGIGELSGSYNGGICGYCLETAVSGCSFGGSFYAGAYNGGIAGRAENSSLTGCSVNAIFHGRNDVAGGICGSLGGGSVTRCTSAGEISGAGFYVGGICGEIKAGSVTGCDNAARVFCSKSGAGGICGRNAGRITRCGNTGDVRSAASSGGISSVNEGSIAECENSGIVYGDRSVGGISGGNQKGEITECRNIGMTIGAYNVGGIAGDNNQSGGQITNCCNTARVCGISGCGGICGSSLGEISCCFSSGQVFGESSVGGVCGYIGLPGLTGSFLNCYYLSGGALDGENKPQNGIGSDTAGSSSADISGQTSGLTEAQMRNGDSFEGFDFAEIWTIGKIPGIGTPTLRWQEE